MQANLLLKKAKALAKGQCPVDETAIWLENKANKGNIYSYFEID